MDPFSAASKIKVANTLVKYLPSYAPDKVIGQEKKLADFDEPFPFANDWQSQSQKAVHNVFGNTAKYNNPFVMPKVGPEEATSNPFINSKPFYPLTMM